MRAWGAKIRPTQHFLYEISMIIILVAGCGREWEGAQMRACTVNHIQFLFARKCVIFRVLVSKTLQNKTFLLIHLTWPV